MTESTNSIQNEIPPFRVLCLDGGGMRGIYTAAYLNFLVEAFARKRNVKGLDMGKSFNLICGTSTGAIIGCALAKGIDPFQVLELYQIHGKKIFPWKVPSGSSALVTLPFDLFFRKYGVKQGALALKHALTKCLGTTTMGELYETRKIALAIPAINLSNHKSWVFKTPHEPGTNHRDDDFTLVDVCMATTAAPIFRSIGVVNYTGGVKGQHYFVDGGLWANNPVLVGLIEALQLVQQDQKIEIYCMGTCPRTPGDNTARLNPNRGLWEWKFGGEAASMSIDAQEFAFDKMAQKLCKYIRNECKIVRMPRQPVPAVLTKYLDLDETSEEAATELIKEAKTDAEHANAAFNDETDTAGQLINKLFMEMNLRQN